MTRPPVFLDRDGTLIVEMGYLKDPERVSLEEGAVDALSMLQGRGHPLIVVSNQSGIGRGLLTEGDAHRVNQRVADLLRPAGIEILAWYMCPHSPETACHCRKPLPGMAVTAARDWSIDLSGCYVVGDKRSDVELADAIGGTGILVTTGHGMDAVEWARAAGRPIFDGLRAVTAYIRELEDGS
jgi:histidinol-phosphate phosphatase family protein